LRIPLAERSLTRQDWLYGTGTPMVGCSRRWLGDIGDLRASSDGRRTGAGKAGVRAPVRGSDQRSRVFHDAFLLFHWTARRDRNWAPGGPFRAPISVLFPPDLETTSLESMQMVLVRAGTRPLPINLMFLHEIGEAICTVQRRSVPEFVTMITFPYSGFGEMRRAAGGTKFA